MENFLASIHHALIQESDKLKKLLLEKLTRGHGEEQWQIVVQYSSYCHGYSCKELHIKSLNCGLHKSRFIRYGACYCSKRNLVKAN